MTIFSNTRIDYHRLSWSGKTGLCGLKRPQVQNIEYIIVYPFRCQFHLQKNGKLPISTTSASQWHTCGCHVERHDRLSSLGCHISWNGHLIRNDDEPKPCFAEVLPKWPLKSSEIFTKPTTMPASNQAQPFSSRHILYRLSRIVVASTPRLTAPDHHGWLCICSEGGPMRGWMSQQKCMMHSVYVEICTISVFVYIYICHYMSTYTYIWINHNIQKTWILEIKKLLG